MTGWLVFLKVKCVAEVLRCSEKEDVFAYKTESVNIIFYGISHFLVKIEINLRTLEMEIGQKAMRIVK